MSESIFDNFEITDDNLDLDPLNQVIVNPKTKSSSFTIIVDSYEQKPYTFRNITGDARDDRATIKVKTVRKRLPMGDYAILDVPGIAIERKSKEDLFGSVGNGPRRENFIERLRKMQSTLRFGAVVIECYPNEAYLNPPEHSSLNPKVVFRTSLSWAIQFPLIHWIWCLDRDIAEQTTYRLLEKYWEHETSEKYKHHNRPIDQNLEAYQLGILSRMTSRETEAGYRQDNPLRLSWQRGWDFWSTHGCDGDRGKVYEIGEMDRENDKPKKTSKKSSKKDQIEPLPGQASFLEDENNEGKQLDNIITKIKNSIER